MFGPVTALASAIAGLFAGIALGQRGEIRRMAEEGCEKRAIIRHYLVMPSEDEGPDGDEPESAPRPRTPKVLGFVHGARRDEPEEQRS